MKRLRYLTAGESHGRQLTAILDGCPAGLQLSAVDIDAELARRQGGYGRGGRMAIERDRVAVAGGVRYGRTTGAPIALVVANRDAANWGETLSPEAPREPGRRPCAFRAPATPISAERFSTGTTTSGTSSSAPARGDRGQGRLRRRGQGLAGEHRLFRCEPRCSHRGRRGTRRPRAGRCRPRGSRPRALPRP